MFLSHIWSESIMLTWGVLTSWMDYLNNLHPCIGGKKWCWMQLINASRNGRKFAYCKLQLSAFFCHLHPEKKRFHSWNLYELLSINMLDLITKPKDWMSAFGIWCPKVLMDITWQNRVKAIVNFVQRTVAWFVMLVMFDCICNVSFYIILTELNL